MSVAEIKLDLMIAFVFSDSTKIKIDRNINTVDRISTKLKWKKWNI